MEVTVSVLMITYNHEKFISQAIEGVLMQKTTFPIELIIGEDCSTDKTREICQKYQSKFSDKIKLHLHKTNLGIMKNFYFIIKASKGKYIALCEGDDYWTDPLKLQKQVDFMEANEDFSICFHPVTVLQEDNTQKEYIFPIPEQRFNKTILTTDDLIKQNFIQTNSVLYRSIFNSHEDYNLLPNDILPGDWYMHLLHSKFGKIGFISDVMSVYRKHSGGVWQNDPSFKYAVEHRNFFKEINLLFDNKYIDEIKLNLIDIYNEIINTSIYKGDFSKLEILSVKYPEDNLIIYELVYQMSKTNNDHIEQLNQIRNSKSYKIGRFILKPLKYLKKIL